MAKNILLVEDDGVIAGMYNTLLKNHGYGVSTAQNGEEGLKKALDTRPDLILLDIRMPKMDGLSMLKKLRGNTWGKNAKVILLTNLEPSDDIIKQVSETEPSYYLIKSNTKPETVLAKIEEVLKGGHTKNG